MVQGTLVKNPMRRTGQTGYVQCQHCLCVYTALGISRHWPKCPVLLRRRSARKAVKQ